MVASIYKSVHFFYLASRLNSTGMTLMNKRNQSRPLDGRPGHDPFDGTDPS
jgi:hypothetical protein